MKGEYRWATESISGMDIPNGVDCVTTTPDGSIIFYTSGPRKCRYDGVFEEEKTRVTWRDDGTPYFEDYWIMMDIIDIRLERELFE